MSIKSKQSILINYEMSENNNNNQNKKYKQRRGGKQENSPVVDAERKLQSAVDRAYNARARDKEKPMAFDAAGRPTRAYDDALPPRGGTDYDMSGAARKYGLDPHDVSNVRIHSNQAAKTTRDIESQDKDLKALRREFEAYKNNLGGRPPLAQIGAGLSGATAKAIRMFADPEYADAVPVPGRNPESILKAREVAKQSIILENGKAVLVVTPYGRYQSYVSRGWNANAPYDHDEIALWANNQNEWAEIGLAQRFYPNTNTTIVNHLQGSAGGAKAGHGRYFTKSNEYTDFYVRASAKKIGANAFQGQSVRMVVSANAINLGLEYEVTTLDQLTNVVLAGPISTSVQIAEESILFSGEPGVLDADNGQIIALPEPTNINDSWYYKIRTRFIRPQNQAQGPDPGQLYTAKLSPENDNPVIPFATGWRNSNEVFDAQAFPTLVSIMQGGLADHGSFLALSGLLTNDSSSLNNNGYIQACSMTTGIYGPNGTSIEDYVGSKTKWNYTGKLAEGAYQVFVPSVTQLANYNDYLLTPFTSEPEKDTYNMVYLLDNSVTPNNEAPPSRAQCHFLLNGVFSSSKIDNFIPMMSFPKDHSFELALGFLRHYYHPCCNPVHSDHIKKWLEKTFKSVIDHGKSMITQYGPGLVDGTASILKTAIPLMVTAAAAL